MGIKDIYEIIKSNDRLRDFGSQLRMQDKAVNLSLVVALGMIGGGLLFSVTDLFIRAQLVIANKDALMITYVLGLALTAFGLVRGFVIDGSG